MLNRIAAVCLLFVALVSMCAVITRAQDLDHAAITGTVTDPNGLAVVGVSVKVKDAANGSELTATTDENGRYRFFNLGPGSYRLTFEGSGFGVVETEPMPVVAGRRIQKDITLRPGGLRVEQTVTADSESALDVDTTRTVVSSTLTEREIEEIPSNSRNPLDLVLALGGTSEEALSTSDLAEDRNSSPSRTPLEQGNFTISGGASYSNNITIDGFDNNDDRSARDRFQPSIDAVGEVQVVRNQFSAEYGRASGGRVNLTIRSGTNKFRGRAFFTYKGDDLNANTWYNNNHGYDRLPFKQYNPGGSFGGPILKNRTFFFVAYENQNFRDTTFIDTYLPTTANPKYTLPAPTDTIIYCDSTGSPIPTPTVPCPAQTGTIQGFTSLVATPNLANIVTARVDHKLTSSNDFNFGWQYGRKVNRRTPGYSAVTRLDDTLQVKNIDTDAYNFRDTQRFGSSVINEAGFQYSIYSPNYQTDNPNDAVVLIGYRNPRTNSLQTLIAGNSSSSSSVAYPDSRVEKRYQFKDSLTYIRGKHIFKAGFDYQHVRSSSLDLTDGTGTYNFSNVYNYSNNIVTRFRQNFGNFSDVTNSYWAVFFNDEIRFGSSATLSYGLRYERETAVKDKNNLGPRLGFAWSPFNDRKGVIRFGGAIVYNRVLLRTVGDFIQNISGSVQSFDTNTIPTTDNIRNNILNVIAQDFPNGYSSIDQIKAAVSRATCGAAACSPTLGFIQNNGNLGNPLRSVDPNLKIPESYNFNVGFEREIAKGWVFEANYTFNRTADLWREYNINAPVAPAGYADLADWLISHPLLFQNANTTIRQYIFYRGDGTSPIASGLTTTRNGSSACPTSGGMSIFTAGGICYVDLNSSSSTTTGPSTNLSDGVASNSIGGPVGIALEAVRSLRPINPAFDEMERVASIGNSRYHGLVLELRSRFRKIGYGFSGSMRFAYTLSRLMDDGLNNTTNAERNSDFSREWARATQDRLHRITVVGTMQTPWWLGRLRFSPMFRFGTSAPFALGTGTDRNLNDVSTDRPDFSGDVKDIKWREPGSAYPASLAAQLSLPTIGSAGGNLSRNAGNGPKLYVFDLSVTREFKFKEHFRLRPAVEFGNILNMAVFSYGSEYIDFDKTPTALQMSSFLVPTRTYRPRDIRLTVRFDF